ncbi:MAG TPA: NfeD family protein [Candidatus Micrarchaeaceae archaeon]|nr:NfeD family protein [Candidatus Micrarchaeaceae archaeon]
MINGIERLVGEEAVVSVAIPGMIHLGSVRARGEEWPALSAVGDPIAKDVIVLVMEVRDGHLVVTPSAS